MVDSKGIPILAMHQVPDAVNQQINGYFNYETPSWAHLAPGQDGYWMVLHELGHGMGLAHPHDGGSETDATKFPGVRKAFFSDTYTTGTNGLNQTIWTVMSYNQGWNQEQAHQTYGQAGTLMAFDIAALQALYGANMSTATGPDTYQLPATLGPGTYWESIWDAGGFDTISNSGSAQACTIDLRAAPLTGANAAGYVSYIPGIPGGFTIANGVVIENALGGLANDVLIGNAANNDLFGGDGNDTMSGGEGNDELWGAGGGDTLTGGRGADYFWYGDTGETGVGVGLRDVITDFKAAQGDTIILLYLDAVVGTADNEAFIYIGAAAFSAAGQLRFENGILSGETTGDGVADFEIHLSGVRNFDGTGLNL